MMEKRMMWLSLVLMFLMTCVSLVQAEESLFTWKEEYFTPYFQSKTLQEYYGKITVKVIDKHEAHGYGSLYGPNNHTAQREDLEIIIQSAKKGKVFQKHWEAPKLEKKEEFITGSKIKTKRAGISIESMLATVLEPFSDAELIKIISEDVYPYNTIEEDIKLHPSRPYLCEVAVKRIKDPERLKEVVGNAKNLGNPFALLAIYRNWGDRVNMGDTISELADHGVTPFVREQATLALPEKELTPHRLNDLLLNSESLDVKRKALLTLYDPKFSYIHGHKNYTLTDSDYNNFIYNVNFNLVTDFTHFEAFSALLEKPSSFPDSLKEKIYKTILSASNNLQGHQVIFLDPKVFESIGDFQEGLARVKLTTGKWGFINKDGKVVIEAKYKDANSFANGLAAVSVDGKWGFINKEGKIVIEPEYAEILSYNKFNNGVVLVRKTRTDHEWLIINEQGAIVGKVQSTSGGFEFSEGLAAAMDKSGKYGYIDPTGKWVIKPSFDKASSFQDGFAAVKPSKNKGGYIRPSGEYAIKPAFEDVDSFSDGLAAVKVKGKWGYINMDGKIVVQPRFEIAYHFAEGLAPVVESFGKDSLLERNAKNKYGFIDKSGQYVIAPKEYHNYPRSFVNGLARVPGVNDRNGYINPKGEFVIGPFMRTERIVYDNLLVVRIYDMYGFVVLDEKK